MTNKLNEITENARKSMKEFAQREDTKAAAKWTKDTSISVGKNAKKFSKTQLGKQMLIPAAIGALIAIPLPIIGPILGAFIGSAWGYYNYMSKNKSIDIESNEGISTSSDSESGSKDVFAELAKLDVLRRSGALNESEFTAAKEILLNKKNMS